MFPADKEDFSGFIRFPDGKDNGRYAEYPEPERNSPEIEPFCPVWYTVPERQTGICGGEII